jgi:CysZ protein
MIKDFISGIKYLLLGFRLIRRPGIRRFVIVPLLINTLVFISAIWFGMAQFESLLDWLLPEGGWWWVDIIIGLLWLLFSLMVMLLMVFTFTLIANLIGAPFNGFLSEKVEAHLRESVKSDSGILGILKTLPTALFSEIRKLLYFLLWVIPLLVISFTPVISIISPALWAIFSAWILSLEYIAYPMENNNIFFKETRSSVRKRRALSLGFGTAAVIMTLIPVINFLVMPSAVAGATAMYVEQLRKQAT